MIAPLWRHLGSPELRCHTLLCDEDGFIKKPLYSRKHGKHEVVEELIRENKWVLAVGDAYNDFSMLRKASLGFLYKPSEKTTSDAADIYIATHYNQIIQASSRICP